jgi:hypothetical protein
MFVDFVQIGEVEKFNFVLTIVYGLKMEWIQNFLKPQHSLSHNDVSFAQKKLSTKVLSELWECNHILYVPAMHIPILLERTSSCFLQKITALAVVKRPWIGQTKIR